MKLKNTFVQGRMNKDIDERLLPKGQYPHAENIRVANTDSSDMGAVENVLGNEKLTSFDLINGKTIGAFSDGSNQKLYWFTTSDNKDMVIEYDVPNSNVNILLESSKPNSVLNFNKDYLITGIVKIINGDSDRDLLIWTDDINPPRSINIKRAKSYGIDNFVEDDISLIKKPPRFSPNVNVAFTSSTLENNLEDKFLSFAYRYKYLDGEYSAISSYTNYKFAPNQFDLDYQTMENRGMINSFNAVNIDFETGSSRVTDIELIFKESNSNQLSIIERYNKKDEGWGDNETQSFQFANSKEYITLPEDELFRTYDNVPLLAKSLESIGNRLVFGNYVEGYDLKNSFGENININYDVSTIFKELAGIQLPVNLSNSIISDDILTFDLTGITLVKNSRLSFDFELDGENTGGNFSDSFDFVLNRDYSSAQELAEDIDFIFFVESVMTTRFLQEYSPNPPDNSEVTNNTNFEIIASNSTTISILAPVIEYTIDNTPLDTQDNPANTTIDNRNWFFTSNSNVFFKETAIDTSLKTNRSYEVGMIYMDEYGRATTVLTDSNNTQYIDQQYSTFQNKLLINVNHVPPHWADRYKFVVKQNKGDYQTIYTNIFYEDGLFRWVKLEGANKDKVKEGDTLIVKSDLGGVVQDIIKVRVLEITTKDKDFLEGNQTVDGTDIIEESGLYMKIKPVGFDMNANEATQRTFQGDSHLRYPTRAYTSPEFGLYNDMGQFVPFSLGAGSTVRIYIKFKARGKIEYEEIYDKEFKVGSDYDSVRQWFNSEVEDLGQFGRDFTWDGVTDIGNNICDGAGEGDANNRGSGWGFGNACGDANEGDERFYVVPHRKGTASRNISTEVRFEIRFSEGTVIFETEPEEISSNIFYETEQIFEIVNNKHQGNIFNQTDLVAATVELDFFNCYIQGNGAESYRYKDAFNTKKLNIDLRPTSTSVEEYKKVRRYSDLTYSEPYNENNNLNGLNEFNLAKVNYKEDLDKKYGYIQKLYSRDTDLIVFQEDKVSKVLYAKDLLMNADGTSNITSLDEVLGQQITFKGEYGISRNPESFAFDGYNIYFTDAKRGAVMRLSNNGLQEISAYGLRQFFRDEFKDSIDSQKLGGFDLYQDQYVLHPSNDTAIPPVNVICKESVLRNDFSGELVINIDYGLSLGETGIDYEVFDGAEMVVKLEWDGNIISSSTVSGIGEIIFNKTTQAPVNAILTISTNDCIGFNVIPKCVDSDIITVSSIVLNDEEDLGLNMVSQYKWSNTEYVSPFKTYNSLFDINEINDFDSISGIEGVDNIPATGSTVYLESYKNFRVTGSFLDGNKIGYLISSVPYTELDIQTILQNAIFPTVTENISLSGEIINSTSFIFDRPSNEEYLYLIWDYRNALPTVTGVTFTNGNCCEDVPIINNVIFPNGNCCEVLAPSLIEISNTNTGVGGTRTQIFQVGQNVQENNVFTLQTYGVIVSVVATNLDIPITIASKLRDAINSTTEAQWDAVGSAPSIGTNGFPPTATSQSNEVTIVLNFQNQFVGNAIIS